MKALWQQIPSVEIRLYCNTNDAVVLDLEHGVLIMKLYSHCTIN